MSRNVLVINVDLKETRVALIEDGVIAELHIERAAHRSTVGNVVLGRVTRVLPGMQAAFIDVGQERAAFLHVEDLIRPEDFDAYLIGDAREDKADAAMPDASGSTPPAAPEASARPASTRTRPRPKPHRPSAESGPHGDDESQFEDGSELDSSEREAELAEAGSAEAGSAEAGSAEAGSAEAGLAEAGSPEAGLPEAGSAEAGLPESGLAEAELAEAEDDDDFDDADYQSSAVARLDSSSPDFYDDDDIEYDDDGEPVSDGSDDDSDEHDADDDLDHGESGYGDDESDDDESDDDESDDDESDDDDDDESNDDDESDDDDESGDDDESDDDESDDDDIDTDDRGEIDGQQSLDGDESDERDDRSDHDETARGEHLGPDTESSRVSGASENDAPPADATEAPAVSADESDEETPRKRSRGRSHRTSRRGRRAARREADDDSTGTDNAGADSTATPAEETSVDDESGAEDASRSRRRRRRRARGAATETTTTDDSASTASRNSRRRRRGRKKGSEPRESAKSKRSNNETKRTPARVSRSVPINDVVKEGDSVVVQISKEPIGTKGARVTSHVSLAGRYVVYLPTVEHVGISKRIGNARERARLRKSIDALKPPTGGLIVRTVAEGLTKKQLKADCGYLIKVWSEVGKRKQQAKAPELLYEELDLVLKAARDLFTDGIDHIVVDDRDQYGRLARFVEMFMPGRVKDIKLYTGDDPIFDAYGIEDEIKRALGRKVPLPSGGSLIVDQAEALTAIDVNTGRYVGKGSKGLEETALKTNLEAVDEIAYQLRFRNIGGLVILDLIDMERAENREKVWRVLEQKLAKDKAKTTINRISDLGLIEMTRKRTRESLGRIMHEPCFYCDGTGHIQSRETVAYEILRQIKRDRMNLTGYSVRVLAHPAVIDFLKLDAKDAVLEAERRYMRRIELVPRQEYHLEQYDLQGK